MNIFFTEKSSDKIIASIKSAMGERELGKMVSFALQGKNLIVTISKLGTSSLTFAHKDRDDGCEYTLTSEKIAFAHKIFKDEVKEKILKVISQAGGKVKA